MPEPAPGTVIGSFRLEATLGRGGMGTVYRALDTRLSRSVAIKFLSDELADATARRRFQREAQLASSLNHPHILTVYDIGEWEERQYIVTEFVDGGTLKDWAKAQERTWRQIVDLLTGVADGLATAHGAGMTHRDIKPANILVAKNGYAKLADFGLAKLAEHGDAEATRTLTEARTREGAVMGTIPYMSPEQVSGKTTDARSDVFSFGVVLYELLTGRRPFRGDSNLEVMNRIIYGCPPSIGQDIPQMLRALVEKALEKEPAERYQWMRDMTVDLRRVGRLAAEPADSSPSGPVPAVAPAKRHWTSLAAGGGLLTIAASLAVWWMNPSVAAGQIRSIAALPLDNYSTDPSQEYFSDGITEALISNLAQIKALTVTSRTSAMRYKRSTKSLPEIGRELGVDAIVEGSVRRVGDRVRITAQLIEVATDRHLWARDYERDVADALKVEGEVAQEIAREIRLRVSPEESSRIATTGRAINPAAQEAFLLGSYSRWKSRPEDLRIAAGHFRRAIAIQTDFAQAYAGLSGALAELGGSGVVEEARSAARKALELDGNLSEAHSALARMTMTLDWDWAAAEQGFKRALELNPNSLEYCQCYADLLAGMGRFPEAIAILDRGLVLNPLSPAIHGAMGRVLVWAHRFDEALPHLQEAVELDAENAVAYLFLGEAYEAKGDLAKALGATREFLRLRATAEEQSPLVGRIYAKMGRRADAQRVLKNITAPGKTPNARDLASLYFALGETERGFAALTQAFDTRGDVLRVRVSALWNDVRPDARFQTLIAKLGVRGQTP